MNDQARKIRAGDARALARTATGIENGDPAALETLHELEPYTGHARIVGITGPPGAGKSTLVDAIAAALREQGKTVAIVAVDPSSKITGGAIMGDRIRMQRHHGDPGIFIRSMASRGNPGGVARATAALVRLMDAAGKDYVLIETVGVGQDEIEIARVAGITVVVLVPGMGDDVQAIKAGILEIADIFVINKSDLPGAGRLERELSGEWHKPIVQTVATEAKGIEDLKALLTGPLPEKRGIRSGTTIDHLGIAVKSLNEAIPLYEAFGLEVVMRETVATEKVHVAMLPAGDSRIELLEPAAEDSPISKFIEKRGGGLHHIALRVPDLLAVVERLRASGAKLLNEPRTGAGGHLYVFVHPSSTGGVLLELVQEER